MVVLGGVKFAPHALESRIRALPGLRDAVLLAVTDASGAEVLAVVLETDMTALTPPMERALTEILAGMVWRFTPYLQPDLPRTQTGKVQRGVLRRLLAPAPVQPGAAAG
jgi:acyl-coenzyme A synthetase/AMP-(fatty) acid ligase